MVGDSIARALPLLLCLSVGSGCSEDSFAPTKNMSAISIVPSTTALRIGESEQFSVVETFSDGTSRPLAAEWSSNNASVVMSSNRGTVSAVLVGSAVLVAVIGGTILTRALQVVPDASGHWSGQFRYTSCSRLVGPGPDLCTVGVRQPLALDLAQSHDQLHGTMEIFLNRYGGTVSGTVGADGTVIVSATLTGDSETDSITDWRSRTVGQALEGQFALGRDFTNFFGHQVLVTQAELVGVTRP